MIDYEEYDVVYITRKQRERRKQDNNLVSYDDFCFTNNDANKLKTDAMIMHPLPRNNELHKDVDTNHRAYYFKQMEYSVQVRMGILEYIYIQPSIMMPSIMMPLNMVFPTIPLLILMTYLWVKNM